MQNDETSARQCRAERLVARALVAGALMSGLNALIQVVRMVAALCSGVH